MVTANYRAVVSYDGTDYAGFQVQLGRRTIQGELERALARLAAGETVRVHGAGRTDAGVHARGQVISFALSWAHGEEALQRGMNALLPADIAVHRLDVAEEGFHARYSAQSRVYLYNVYQAPVRMPLWGRYAHRVSAPLDHEAVAQAAAGLVGERDLATFGQPTQGTSTVRRVIRAEWRPVDGAVDGATRWQLLLEANAFLRGMVRRMVGTLLAVGMGTLGLGELEEIVSERDIARAAPPAPACGLCLWRVRYGPDDGIDDACRTW